MRHFTAPLRGEDEITRRESSRSHEGRRAGGRGRYQQGQGMAGHMVGFFHFELDCPQITQCQTERKHISYGGRTTRKSGAKFLSLIALPPGVPLPQLTPPRQAGDSVPAGLDAQHLGGGAGSSPWSISSTWPRAWHMAAEGTNSGFQSCPARPHCGLGFEGREGRVQGKSSACSEPTQAFS